MENIGTTCTRVAFSLALSKAVNFLLSSALMIFRLSNVPNTWDPIASANVKYTRSLPKKNN